MPPNPKNKPARRSVGKLAARSGADGRFIAKQEAASASVVISRTTLKKAGGSLVITVPARARDALHLVEGQELTVAVEGQRLVLEAARPKRPSYTLGELLAACDFDEPYSDEERAWLDAAPVGRELL